MNETKNTFKDADPKLLKTVTGKIFAQHLAKGALKPGEEIGIVIDQTLTQDATVRCLPGSGSAGHRPRQDRIVGQLHRSQYPENGSQNADDHDYLQSVAANAV